MNQNLEIIRKGLWHIEEVKFDQTDAVECEEHRDRLHNGSVRIEERFSLSRNQARVTGDEAPQNSIEVWAALIEFLT